MGPGGKISMRSVPREKGEAGVSVSLWQPLVAQRAPSKLQSLLSDTLHCTALTRDIGGVTPSSRRSQWVGTAQCVWWERGRSNRWWDPWGREKGRGLRQSRPLGACQPCQHLPLNQIPNDFLSMGQRMCALV